MKTTQINFLLFSLLCFLSCDLDKIEPAAPACPGNLNAQFSADKTTCEAPCTITFTSTGTGADTYQWNFANGQSASVEKPAPVNFTTPGNYKVKLLVSNKNGCKDSSELDITINAPPLKVFACFSYAAGNDGVAPSSVSFNAGCSQNTQGATFSWDFDDPASGAANNASGATPNHTFSTPREYKVKLSVQGQTTDDTTIVVNIKAPTVTACFTHSSTNNYIAPSTVSFKADCSQGALNYNWNFGDPGSGSNNTAVGINPSHNYTQPGAYGVKLTVQNGAITKDTTISVVVKSPPPVANFTISNDNCLAPCTVTFTNTSTNTTSSSWTFGDGTTAATTSPSKTYNEGKTYSVVLTATGPGGTSTATKNVKIRAGVRKIVNLGTEQATPLYGIEKSAGAYHVLYSAGTGSTKTVALDTEGNQVGSISTHGITSGSNTEQVDATGTSDGKFIVIGNNYSTNKVWISGITHGSTVWNRDYLFGGTGNLAQAGSVTSIDNNRIAVTGLYIITGDGGGGLIVMSTSGDNPLVNTKIADVNSAIISPLSVAQNPSGGFNFFCSEYTFGGTASKFFIKTNGSGTYQSLVDYGTGALSGYTTLRKISGDNYLLFGESLKTIKKLNGSGTATADLTVNGVVRDAKATSDGHLILCGTEGKNLYLAKINTSSWTIIWEKSFADATGNIAGVSVVQTLDKGYFAVGTVTLSGGGKSIYFVKTDANGNAD